MKRKSTATRRQFLKRATATAAATVAAPYIIPASALGQDGRAAPSNRIVMATIGYGMQGPGNMEAFMNEDDVQMVAVCDLDDHILARAKKDVDRRYDNTDCVAYTDYRELIARGDIDAMNVSVPDHWHGLVYTAGIKAGMDMYGEKPLSHNIAEGEAIVKAVERYGRIWQTGSWQRSVGNFRKGVELVRNGYIGKVHTVEVGLPSGHEDFGGTAGQETPGPAPENLHYDFWLGPAPWAEYCPARVHQNWRWHLDYGGGQITDWIGHHCDIAHWGLGNDDKIGPSEVEGVGEYPTKGLWNTATRYRVTCKYPDDVTVIIAGGHDDIRMGTKWIGPDGWVWVDRGGFRTSPASLKDHEIGPNELNLLRSPGHQRNFLDCVKSREQTLAPAVVAHHSQIPGHLGQIAMILGRKIKWDAQAHKIIDDEAATRMLSRTMRAPWHM